MRILISLNILRMRAGRSDKLGLMVELSDRYVITSNRESGLGRYDVMMEPRHPEDSAAILEFKVHDPGGGSRRTLISYDS